MAEAGRRPFVSQVLPKDENVKKSNNKKIIPGEFLSKGGLLMEKTVEH